MWRPPTCTPPTSTRPRDPSDDGGWVGLDRGLSAFVVAADADGTEVARVSRCPQGVGRRDETATTAGEIVVAQAKRDPATAVTPPLRLARHHHHVANVRRHFLHQVSNALVKTHDRLVIEDLQRGRDAGQPPPGTRDLRCRLGRICHACWRYKQAWRGSGLVVADRWYPSSKQCAACGAIRKAI